MTKSFVLGGHPDICTEIARLYRNSNTYLSPRVNIKDIFAEFNAGTVTATHIHTCDVSLHCLDELPQNTLLLTLDYNDQDEVVDFVRCVHDLTGLKVSDDYSVFHQCDPLKCHAAWERYITKNPVDVAVYITAENMNPAPQVRLVTLLSNGVRIKVAPEWLFSAPMEDPCEYMYVSGFATLSNDKSELAELLADKYMLDGIADVVDVEVYDAKGNPIKDFALHSIQITNRRTDEEHTVNPDAVTSYNARKLGVTKTLESQYCDVSHLDDLSTSLPEQDWSLALCKGKLAFYRVGTHSVKIMELTGLFFEREEDHDWFNENYTILPFAPILMQRICNILGGARLFDDILDETNQMYTPYGHGHAVDNALWKLYQEVKKIRGVK